MKHYLIFLNCLITFVLTAQKNTITRIDPSFWWAGMNNPELELLVYQAGIGKATATLNYPGVEIVKSEPAENPDFLYITLLIKPSARPGKFPITFRSGSKKLIYHYELKQRSSDPRRVQGITTADLIYLIMPDRFCNGDPSNDVILGTQEPKLNRDSMYWRHGGDLQGIRSKLGYLSDLGVSALWFTPVLTNDQPRTSYHGYAITDHYRIDPRFGSNELYRQLTEDLHAKGMKMVMDIVPNHIGSEHWLFKNMPSKDWVHQFNTLTKTNFRAPTLMDPYASDYDKDLMRNGWFDKHMPDLNQENPHVARYLTQSYIWWVEYTGLDAFRIDTYPYSDLAYLSDMAGDILREYPNIGMFAEIWEHGVAVQAFFAEKYPAKKQLDSHLPSTLDFQVYFAISEALNKPFGWTEGITRLYYVLAQDNLYEDPFRNVLFLDNHDLSRFFSVAGEDLRKFRAGINLLMTLRGIPQLYYGTEILMKNFSDPDGKVRSDFPGGWKGDRTDKFTEKGRTTNEQEAFSLIRKLAHWRRGNPAITEGKLMQFVPEKGLYVYFRYTDTLTVMVITNCSDEANLLPDPARYDERLKTRRRGTNVVSGQSVSFEGLNLAPWESLILEID